MRYSQKWPEYAKQWNAMSIKANRTKEFTGYATKILANKTRYQAIERLSNGVPWELIALLHLRESNCNFGTYLGNGQSLGRRTTIVPVNRGPFTGPAAFENGALDALRIDGLSDVRDWRLEKMLFFMEQFNGWGYALNGLPSPYLFGGTTIQKPGKYVRDRVLDRKVWDTQPGCAAILKVLAQMDDTIQLTRET